MISLELKEANKIIRILKREKKELIAENKRYLLSRQNLKLRYYRQFIEPREDELDMWERSVIKFRFGKDEGISRTYKEIGIILGVSTERVYQLEAEAISKIQGLF